MLRLFRTNQHSVSLLLFAYALLLQLPLLLWGGRAVARYDGGGGSYVGDWLTGAVAVVPVLSVLLPPLLLAATGYFANLAAGRYRMSAATDQFPGLCVVLLWGLSPGFRLFDVLHFNHLFLALAVLSLGSTYRSKTAHVAQFNAGWWLGLAGLLDTAYLLFVVAFVVGTSIFRTAGPRAVLQLLVGAGVPFFLAATGAYVLGVESWWRAFGWSAAGPVALFDGGYVRVGILLLLFPLAAVLTGLGRQRALLSIEGGKNVSFLFWLLLFSLPVALLGGDFWARTRVQVLVLPLGMLFGLWLSSRRARVAEWYHLVLLSAALILASFALLQ